MSKKSEPGVTWVIESKRHGSRRPWKQWAMVASLNEAEAQPHVGWLRERHAGTNRIFRAAKYVREEK